MRKAIQNEAYSVQSAKTAAVRAAGFALTCARLFRPHGNDSKEQSLLKKIMTALQFTVSQGWSISTCPIRRRVAEMFVEPLEMNCKKVGIPF